MADELTVVPVRKRCVFCGSREKKISNEHIVGARWSDVFTQTSVKHRRFGWKMEHDGVPSDPWDDEWHPKDGLDFKANVVCRDCNSGWMDQLDDAVEPFVRPMVMDAERQALDLGQSADLARWIARIAIMIACSQNAEWTFSEEQAATVMAGGFPEGFHVWALAWVGDRMVHLWSTPFAGPPPARERPHCITSFTLGHMYFLSAHTRDPSVPINFQWLFGKSIDARTAEWVCPPDLSASRPDMLPEYHEGAVREWVKLLDEMGVYAAPGDERLRASES